MMLKLLTSLLLLAVGGVAIAGFSNYSISIYNETSYAVSVSPGMNAVHRGRCMSSYRLNSGGFTLESLKPGDPCNYPVYYPTGFKIVANHNCYAAQVAMISGVHLKLIQKQTKLGMDFFAFIPNQGMNSRTLTRFTKVNC